MKLQGKKIAIFVENIYEDLEFWYPKIRMQEEGAEVEVIAPKEKVYKGKHGMPAEVDIVINKAKPEDYDALLIPGGYSPDHMRRIPEMVGFVGEMNNLGKVIAAICHGGWMLASADIVKDKNVTGFFSIKVDMINAGAEWHDKEVVRDGNLITSRNPGDLPAYCRTIIEALNE